MVFTSFFLSLFICVLMLFYQWNDENKSFIYLCAILLICSIRQLELILFKLSIYSTECAIIFIHTNPITCMLGPLFFYYFKSIIKGKMIIDYYFLIYLIPSFIILINSIPYYQLSFAEKMHYLSLVQNENSSNIVEVPLLLFKLKYQQLILPMYNFALVFYSFFFTYKKNKLKEFNLRTSVYLSKIIWITIIYILPFILLIIHASASSMFIFSFAFDHVTYSFNFIYFLTLILPLSLIVFFPTFMFGTNPSTNTFSWIKFNFKNTLKNSFEKIEEKTEKTVDLDRILNYFETKKPYLNANFSIHDLSLALNIPQIRISICFNKQINIPFPTFRNHLRIKHAVQMFREQKHLQMSIEGISEKSGFKTLSAFYAAFRAEYKMTPTVWIEKNL